jgi:DNA-binding NarL/FixJ family response regulator
MKSSAMLLADTLLVNAFARVHTGAYVEARTYLRRALAILGETRVSWYRARCVALWLQNATGEAEPSALDDRDSETLDAAFASGKASLYGPLAAVSAVDLLRRGDAATARALVYRAVNAASAAASSLGSFPLVVVAALACDGSIANAVRALAARDASKGPAPAAAAELVIAILARRFGAAQADLEPARRAAAGFAAVGWPYFEALALDEAGDRVAATAIRERIGHAERAQPADREGIRSLLTAREIQVASLVSRGQTNREVANGLFVSVKLVEKQLSSIYCKLGVSSRSQLTARLLAPDANEIGAAAPISS